MNNNRIKELAALLARRSAELDAQEEKPRLALVERKPPTFPVLSGVMDPATRESHIRMITSLSRAYRPYGLHLIVNRATVGRGTVYDLSDEELVTLHRDLYRGLECVRNDIPFEHAGLIEEGDSCAWLAS